jgi:hypothetical protein
MKCQWWSSGGPLIANGGPVVVRKWFEGGLVVVRQWVGGGWKWLGGDSSVVK